MRWLRRLAFLLCCGIVGCGPTCDDAIVNEVTSQRGEYIATVYERDCGATTDFATLVNIRPKASGFDGKADIVFIGKGRHPVDVVWEPDDRLSIACKDCDTEDVFKRESAWKSVAVSIRTRSNGD